MDPSGTCWPARHAAGCSRRRGREACAPPVLTSPTAFPIFACLLRGPRKRFAAFTKGAVPRLPAREDLQMLHARAERHPFVRLIDRAIPGDARIVDVGCGTGQMCVYLARADRVVVGADLARASLVLGAAAAVRFRSDRVQFVETDLRRPGLRRSAFDVVYSSGVVHHTPDPRASFAQNSRTGPPRRPCRARCLQRYRAHSVAASAGCRAALARQARPVRSGASRSGAGPARRDAWVRDRYRHQSPRNAALVC